MFGPGQSTLNTEESLLPYSQWLGVQAARTECPRTESYVKEALTET